jgi:hypothetical protein
LVDEFEGKRRAFLQEARSLVHAWLAAGMKGHVGMFVEGYGLDATMEKKVPAKMVGRVLTTGEAEKLLKQMG